MIAFALGHPGFGPMRSSAELRRAKRGGIVLSPQRGCTTCFVVTSEQQGQAPGAGGRLRGDDRTGSSTTAVRSGTCKCPGLGRWSRWDCFFIRRLYGAKGAVWQYTAIDVASAYCWAELHLTPQSLGPVDLRALPTRGGQSCLQGWSPEKVMSDNASEFRSAEFEAAEARVGARHLFIRAGRPQTNGVVERVQETILDECWKPALRPVPDPQIHWAAAGPGPPPHLQHRPRPHPTVDQGPDPRGGYREEEDVVSPGES